MGRAFLISSLLHLLFLLAPPQWISPLMTGHVPSSGGSLDARLVGPRPFRAPEELGAVLEKSRLVAAKDRRPKVATAPRGNSGLQPSPVPVGLPSGAAAVNSAPQLESAGRDRQTEVEASSVDAEELRTYRFAVARAAGRNKRYPEVARQRGWEGVVTVAVSLSPAGLQPAVSLVRSSGHEALDRQALEMLEAALRQVVLPPGLQGRAYSFSVPVRYALGE